MTQSTLDAAAPAAATPGTETTCDPGQGRGSRPDRPVRPVRLRVRAAAAVWPALLTAAAESAGDRVAIRGPGGPMSYRELDEWSSRWARLLIDRGVGPGEVVAIAGSGSASSALAVWAVVKSGAAWLPLDPTLPPARAGALLATARPVLGLRAGAGAGAPGVPWLGLDDPDTVARVRAHPAHPVSYLDRVRAVSPHHPAVLLPACGPGGRVRTVVLTQAALARWAPAGRGRIAGGTRVRPAGAAQSGASLLAVLLAVAPPDPGVPAPPMFGVAPVEGPSTPPTRTGALPRRGGFLPWASTPPVGTGGCAAGTALGRSRAEVRDEAAVIDAALTAVPGVQFAVTMPRHLPSGRSVWVSYLCPAPDADLDPAAVHRHLATRLPAHRLPAAVRMLTPPAPGPRRPVESAPLPPLGPGCAAEDLAVLLPLRPTGVAAPLFCIHPLGGLAWGFAGLAAHLGPDRPLYGLQSPALGADPVLPATMEHWARRYLHEIRRIQPHGPYHLLGWSLGGMLAHTLAVLLRRAGEAVPTVAMLDAHTHPPLAMRSGTPDPVDLLRRELDLDTGAVPASVTARMRAAVVHARTVLPTFTPGRFDGDLLYFAATRNRPAGLDPDGGWHRHVAGTVHVEPIDATHTRMTSPAALARIGPMVDRWMSRPTAGTGG